MFIPWCVGEHPVHSKSKEVYSTMYVNLFTDYSQIVIHSSNSDLEKQRNLNSARPSSPALETAQLEQATYGSRQYFCSFLEVGGWVTGETDIVHSVKTSING